MKIVKLTIHNFLKLKDVEVDPSKVNVIIGKNKQGKTSILKAIQAAFTGKVDETSIHDSETKAEITVDMDEFKIERSITAKGNSLTVSNKDGWQVPAPQKFLDGMIGQFSFNPIEFFNLKSADKKKYLLQAIDIKLTPEKLEAIIGEKVDMDLDRHGLEVIAELYKHYYQKRAESNKIVSMKDKSIKELSSKIPEDFDKNQTVSTLLIEIDRLRKSITANENNKIVIDNLNRNMIESSNRITKLEEELKNEKAKLKGFADQFATIEIVDTSTIENQLAEAEEKREILQLVKQVNDLTVELTEETKEQDRLDKIVTKLSKEVPDQLIKEADLPVEGLKVEENSVALNGVDIENLSASEQLNFALQVVRKLNGKFKIICIDGVEILDKETFEWFISEIGKDDYQYFITRVDGEKGWIMDNGQIKNS